MSFTATERNIPFLKGYTVWLLRRWGAEKRHSKLERENRERAKSSAEKKADKILADVARTEAASHLALLVLTSSIGVLAYKGLTTSIGEGGLTFFVKAEAALIALALAVVAQLGWTYVFRLVPQLRGRFLAAALFAATLFLGAIVAIDARFNMLGMAGDTAAQLSFVDVASSHEQRLQAVLAQGAAARQLLPAIRAQASRFRGASEAEIKGAYTGSPKPGAVSASYGLVATQLGQLGTDINTALLEIEKLEAAATTLLAEMKREVFAAGAVRARAQTISIFADRLDAVAGQMLQRDFRVSIAAVLDAVERSIPVPKPGAATGLTKVQEVQLARANETVGPAAETLRTGLKALGRGSAPAAKRPESPGTAIFTYWRALFGQWLASLFLDVAPAALVGVLIAARRQAERALRLIATGAGT